MQRAVAQFDLVSARIQTSDAVVPMLDGWNPRPERRPGAHFTEVLRPLHEPPVLDELA